MIDALDINITSGPNAPGHARSLVGGFTRGQMSLVIRQNAELLVSELTSNAVTHAHASDPLRLELALHEKCLHVGVTDRGPGFIAPEHPRPTREGGFGLYLLDSAADRWGVVRGDARCRVWFELDRAAAG
ncbi:MAG: ATP-binding protein [Solirubrobacteraceae bacterium]